ncbi:MAG: homoserine kinase [Bacteroidota bacterium]|nr:homoserine kinase [Bacteroidota bacterium]
MNGVRLFSPATISNLSCGFDVLGLCLETIGDYMEIIKSKRKGIYITSIIGEKVPYDVKKNVAGVASEALIDSLKPDFGFEIKIDKKIKPGSGIGSSAASSVGAVVGINHLLGNPYKLKELIPYALEGEKLACGSKHADNVAPAILGGITLVRSTKPIDIIKLPIPENLKAVIIHPKIEIKTADARKVLDKSIPLEKASQYWANLGAFVSSLYENNYELMKKSIVDNIIEPKRSQLIPMFDSLKQIANDNDSIGCGISGSGPSVFSLANGLKTAKIINNSFKKIYEETGIPFKTYVSDINKSGVKILSTF